MIRALIDLFLCPPLGQLAVFEAAPGRILDIWLW